MMTGTYFSDRELGPRPRTKEVISERVWEALRELIKTRIVDGSFGWRFPASCDDGRGPCGTDASAFWSVARGEVPDLPDERWSVELPNAFVILDFLQFCAQAVARPIQRDFHAFFEHYHLSYDREAGLADFVASVNRLFARNGIAFELTDKGYARRLGPPGLREQLQEAVFHTGDDETDRLLETARRLILSPHDADRRDALEKLWDAFERIKTLEPGVNEREQANRLLDRTADAPKLRNVLDEEAGALTNIGNSLRIRHSETTQEPVQTLEQVDYLFHRMFSFLRLVLRATSRSG
jgi:hypothetical protein